MSRFEAYREWCFVENGVHDHELFELERLVEQLSALSLDASGRRRLSVVLTTPDDRG